MGWEAFFAREEELFGPVSGRRPDTSPGGPLDGYLWDLGYPKPGADYEGSPSYPPRIGRIRRSPLAEGGPIEASLS